MGFCNLAGAVERRFKKHKRRSVQVLGNDSPAGTKK